MENSSRKKSTRVKQQDRRDFMRAALFVGGTVSLSLLGYLPLAQGESQRLRPPGAIKTPDNEQDFFAACIKCGQCVQVCPVEALLLADIDEGFGIGIPYIDARQQACDFSCDGLQCVLACPTGALTHEINYPAESTMAFARLANPDTCLAVLGKGLQGPARQPPFTGLLRYDAIDRWSPQRVADQSYDLEVCDLCVRLCPIEIRIAQCEAGKPPSGDANQCPPHHAIKLEPFTAANGEIRLTPKVLQGCVGCGVCEMVCPTQTASIVMDLDIDRLTVTRAGG
ncbi:MAG: 4Fe-4S binding protein [Gammaproteobacteria bacterium]|nr:4Fe-4S binding protein [Gammaproteobacteria bacterium]